MDNRKRIELTGINLAHFLASMDFHDNTKWRFPQKTITKFVTKDQRNKYEGIAIVSKNPFLGDKYYISQEKYKTQEEWYTVMKPYQIARIQYIYNWMKENYPENDYAEEFLHSEAWGLNGYWGKELGIVINDIIS